MAHPRLFGPIDASVLTEQKKHRSLAILDKKIDRETPLTATHAANHMFWRLYGPGENVLHARVLDILDTVGLLRAVKCGQMVIDNHLITALVERWRPKTHTFHFTFGEATVTLQDVAIIWGLRVDGLPLISEDCLQSSDMWEPLIFQYLGFFPQPGDMKGVSKIHLSAIQRHLQSITITEWTPQIIVNQYARGCILLMLGGFLILDSSRAAISLLYLLAIRDLGVAATYSWGSAVLGYLYRELYFCADITHGRTVIAGPLSLLQIWAWSRIQTVAPTNIGWPVPETQLIGNHGRVLGGSPWGIRWMTPHDHTTSASHSLRTLRGLLDQLKEVDFTWVPYNLNDDFIFNMPTELNTMNWLAPCPLICMTMVELHHPERVLRQFKRVQNIPPLLEDAHGHCHRLSNKGAQIQDWSSTYKRWIRYWRTKEPCLETSLIGDGPSVVPEYIGWFSKITRKRISPLRYDGPSGFQPPAVPDHDAQMSQMMERVRISVMNVNEAYPDPVVQQLRHDSLEAYDHWADTYGLSIPAHVHTQIHENPQVNVDQFTSGRHFTSDQYVPGPSTDVPSSSRPHRRVDSQDGDIPSNFGLHTPYSATEASTVPQNVYVPQPATHDAYTTSPFTPSPDQGFMHLLQTGFSQAMPWPQGVNISTFGAPTFASSPIQYPSYGHTSTFNQSRTNEVAVQDDNNERDERPRRPRRDRHPPNCGTGGRRGI